MTKKFTLIILILITLISFSACSKNQGEKSPVVSTDTNQNDTTASSTNENLPIWPEPIYTEDDYIGWKTYTNEKLGYSIKYPADWTINACDEGCTSKEVIINPPDAEMFTSYISISLESRDIELIRSVLLNPKNYGGKPNIESSILFSQQKAYAFDSKRTQDSRKVFVDNNNKKFLISTGKENNDKVLQALASFEFIDEERTNIYEQKYTDPELSLNFNYPENCLIKTSKESPYLDKGKIKEINVLCGRNIVISFKYISEDYEEGNGEGCCFYYSNKPLNTNLSYDVIKDRLKEFNPTEIKSTEVDGFKSIQFYSEKNYINTWEIQETIIPQNNGEYSNLLISSPDVNDLESFIIYKNIFESIKLQ